MLAGLLVFLCVTGGAVGFASNEGVEAQQGTRVESLLRRMQHVELDGYQAKLVVLQTLDPGARPARRG